VKGDLQLRIEDVFIAASGPTDLDIVLQ
jgi:hypothetical protein